MKSLILVLPKDGSARGLKTDSQKLPPLLFSPESKIHKQGGLGNSHNRQTDVHDKLFLLQLMVMCVSCFVFLLPSNMSEGKERLFRKRFMFKLIEKPRLPLLY